MGAVARQKVVFHIERLWASLQTLLCALLSAAVTCNVRALVTKHSRKCPCPSRSLINRFLFFLRYCVPAFCLPSHVAVVWLTGLHLRRPLCGGRQGPLPPLHPPRSLLARGDAPRAASPECLVGAAEVSGGLVGGSGHAALVPNAWLL